MSVLFHHYKELIQLVSEVEQMGAKVNNGKKKKGLTKEEEKQEEENLQLQQRQLRLSEF
jgi:hypothetical protein